MKLLRCEWEKYQVRPAASVLTHNRGIASSNSHLSKLATALSDHQLTASYRTMPAQVTSLNSRRGRLTRLKRQSGDGLVEGAGTTRKSSPNNLGEVCRVLQHRCQTRTAARLLDSGSGDPIPKVERLEAIAHPARQLQLSVLQGCR